MYNNWLKTKLKFKTPKVIKERKVSLRHMCKPSLMLHDVVKKTLLNLYSVSRVEQGEVTAF